jgi:hypothetical protein
MAAEPVDNVSAFLRGMPLEFESIEPTCLQRTCRCDKERIPHDRRIGAGRDHPPRLSPTRCRTRETTSVTSNAGHSWAAWTSFASASGQSSRWPAGRQCPQEMIKYRYRREFGALMIG